MATLKTLDEKTIGGNLPNSPTKINLKERISYSIGDVGANVVWATLASFMTFFFTDVAGIGAAVVGTIFLISRFLDAFSDLGMGIIVDRTKSKYGKARPWILWVAIPYAVGGVLLFSAPDLSMTGKIIYAFVTYNLMSTVLYTMFAQPYHTLMALMTQDQYERSILTVLRMFAGTVTAIIINNITLPLVNFFGGGAGGWQKTMAVYGVIAVIIFFIVFANTRERIKPVTAKKIPVLEGLKSLFSNKYWVMVLFVGVLVYIIMAIPGVFIYYASYILGDAMYLGQMMTFHFLPTIIALALLPILLKKIDKKKLVFIGFFFYLIGTVALMYNPNDLNTILAGIFLRGIGFAPIVGTLYVFIADTIEYGEWKTGIRTEGLNMSAASFGQKVGTGLGLAVIGWMLAFGGYVGNAPTQPESALEAISFLFIHFPFIVYALIIIILWFYKLDKEYPKIVAELSMRR